MQAKLHRARASLADASKSLGHPVSDKPSPFSADRGILFEQKAFSANGKAIREKYQQAGLLTEPRETYRFGDLAQTLTPQERASELGRRVTRTRELLDDERYDMIIHPHLHLDIGLQEPVLLIPDLLVRIDDAWRPSDLKSFADVGSSTNPQGLRSARRQITFYVMALQQIFGEDAVAPRGDLLLSAQGTYALTLRQERLSSELRELSSAVRKLADVPYVEDLATDARALEQLTHRYVPECGDYCALAYACAARARERGDLLLIDRRTEDMCGGLETMGEYEAVMDAVEETFDDPALTAMKLRHEGILAVFSRTVDCA